MGILSWFGRKKDAAPDFEVILNELEESIRAREEKLAFIKHREHRGVVIFTGYSVAAWIIYSGLWWFGILEWFIDAVKTQPADSQHGHLENEAHLLADILQTLPIALVPILYIFTRRIVKWYYGRKQQRESRELTALRKKQRDQIDALKKLSNYDKITEMLEKHGQSSPRSPRLNNAAPGGAYNTPAKGAAQNGQGIQNSPYATPGGKGGPGITMTPTPAQQLQAAQRGLNGMPAQQGQNSALSPLPAGRPQNTFGTPVRSNMPPGQWSVTNAPLGHSGYAGPPPTQPRGLIDKLAEALLGDNEQSPSTKYALICQRCFAHNGLVLKEEIMDIQFVCPKCGFFNPSRRARAGGDSSEAIPPSSSNIAPRMPSLQKRSSEGLKGTGRSSPLSQEFLLGDASPSGVQDNEFNEESVDADGVEDEDEDEEEEDADDSILRSKGSGDDAAIKTAPMKADDRKKDLRQRLRGQQGSRHGADSSMEVDE